MIYVAGALTSGAIRSDGAFDLFRWKENVARANTVALEVWKSGYAAFCIHKMCEDYFGTMPEHVFISAGLRFLERCSGVVLVRVKDFELSRGTHGEIRHAFNLGIPVFKDAQSLRDSNLPRDHGIES